LACGYLGVPLLDPSIGLPACESARPSSGQFGLLGPPLLHPNKLMPPDSQFPSLPGAECARLHPRV